MELTTVGVGVWGTIGDAGESAGHVLSAKTICDTVEEAAKIGMIAVNDATGTTIAWRRTNVVLECGGDVVCFVFQSIKIYASLY